MADKPGKKFATPGEQKTRIQRVNNRLKTQVEANSAGQLSLCKQCGKPFNQVWMPDMEKYTQFQTCENCRMSNANGVSKATIEYSPHPKQELIHASKARFKCIVAGARFGKDRCSIMEFISKFAEMLSEERGSDMVPSVHGWLIAPTYTLARQSWRELKAFLPREWVENYWESDKMIQTVNGGMIEVRSADDPNSLVGVGIDIVLITEAARIKHFDEVWANIEMRLASPGRGPDGQGGLGLINSSPQGLGFFYTMFRWGQKGSTYYDEDWESWQFSSWDNPYLMRKDKKFLEGIKRRFPARVYEQDVMGQFLPEGNCMFPTAGDCAKYIGDGTVEPHESYVIGYDPGKSIDYAGVAIRNGRGETVKIRQWSGMGWDAQFDRIAMYSRLYNHAPIVMDRTGLGEVIPSQLTRRGLDIEDVYFSVKEKENMVNNLAMLIEQHRISYPKFEPLLLEFKDYQYQVSAKTKNISFGNASTNGHDDLVTAMMLAYKNFDSIDETLPFVGLIGGISRGKKRRTA